MEMSKIYLYKRVITLCTWQASTSVYHRLIQGFTLSWTYTTALHLRINSLSFL